jgi:putative phosphoribosyl transferase
MTIQTADIEIPIDNIVLNGILQIPKNGKSIVLFVHGSGSSRLSTRNKHVADILNKNNIATLLFDLLTVDEEQVDELTREHRFDIPLLTSRLLAVTTWLTQQPTLNNFTLGYFGASTGAAAALQAAAKNENLIQAVVSRGGRPDLTGPTLSQVKAATLLIVGGNDEPVIEMNREAMKAMTSIKKLEIIPDATHLFEEPGALDEAARLATNWFRQYL